MNQINKSKSFHKSTNKKILLISPWESPFIQKDYDLLSKHFEVKLIKHIFTKDDLKGTVINLAQMVNGVLWADLTYSWFAGTHAFFALCLAKIFRKKSIVIVGGFEVACVPEIEYGPMLNPKSLTARMTKLVLNRTDMVITCSKSSAKEAVEFIADSKCVKFIYPGIEPDRYTTTNKKDSELIITVAHISDRQVTRKSLDVFVQCSKLLPDMKFVLIGKHIDNSIDYLKSIGGQNIEFPGYVSDDELINWYQRAKVYVQVSAHEGFGISLAEAMLYECIPVVTKRGAIPEVVGETGYYVPYKDVKATSEAIKIALKSDKGKDSKERIKNLFSIEKRDRELVKTINQVFEKK